MDDLTQFKTLFFQSAEEHITALTSLLMEIKVSYSNEIAEQLHLHAHSLKGEAQVMHYDGFGLYAGTLEEYFKRLSSETIRKPEEIIVLQSAVKEMHNFLELLRDTNNEPEDTPAKVERLRNELRLTT